jgi:competence protein ComEA
MTTHNLSSTVLRAASALVLLAVLAALPAAAATAPSKAPATAKAPAKTEAGVVNVNTATAAQLALLPHIGPSIAQRILDLRKSDGPFKGADDLMLVRGIGERTFALIKDYVVVKGKTTLSAKVHTSRSSNAGESR